MNIFCGDAIRARRFSGWRAAGGPPAALGVLRLAPRRRAGCAGRGRDAVGQPDHAHLPLRERNRDPVCDKKPPDVAVDRRAHAGRPLRRVGDPEAELEIDAVRAEADEIRRGRRILEHALDALRRVGEQRHRVLDVRRVRDLNRDLRVAARQVRRLVLHDVGDELLVRNQRLVAVEAAHDRVARADLRDDALQAAHVDRVAEPQRAVEQDDEARHIVARNFLQAEAEPDAERAAEHAEHGHVDADERQPDQHRREDEERTADAREHDPQVRVERARAHQPLLEHRAEPHRDDERHADPQRARHDRQQREARVRDAELDAVEPAEHVALDAEYRERHRDPHDDRHELLDDRQPRVRVAVAREHAARDEEQDVDEPDAEERHERELQERRRHQLVERRLREPHEHAADEREQRAVQAQRARAGRAPGRATARVDAPAQMAREQPRERERAEERDRLPDHRRLAEVVRDGREPPCEVVRHHAAARYCARRSSTAAKKPSVAWRCGQSDR
ncbi:hypothetical protein BURPS1710b_1128 [Burkholderia pseudomallei 1710b]|uniref:Uncharacterized protein n=1 Tax=Burkholderia pseudomallei (strain 1710b) TaxID=320372 RepID=Q3JV63_BURP1|nr:hypothetical protein BURPS1710b_1128 [Burkholderia pseudomallei 1710b]